MSSVTLPPVTLSADVATALRVLLPIVYTLAALAGVVGSLMVLQIICANRFRHKAVHMLVVSFLCADLCFLLLFTIVRAVSYGYADTAWIVSRADWCKAEMYLLRLFDFVLAYSLVALCVERAAPPSSCWYGARKFRSALTTCVCVWSGAAYALIPILLFRQDLAYQSYGGYLCFSTDESVSLFWLGAFPRRTLDFVDIVFRVFIPIGLMALLLLLAVGNLLSSSSSSSSSTSSPSAEAAEMRYKVLSSRGGSEPIGSPCVGGRGSGGVDQLLAPHIADSSFSIMPSTHIGFGQRQPLRYQQQQQQQRLSGAPAVVDVMQHHRRLYAMTLSYALLFAACQLPYEIYRCVMLTNSDVEASISYANGNYDFAIEIPLLLLKLLNRTLNPFLFVCFADVNGFRRRFCRLWCCPCLPGCVGCRGCWCRDCAHSLAFELDYCLGRPASANNDDADNWVPTGLQTVSTYQYMDGDRLITKQRIVEEFETGVQPYYKNTMLLRRGGTGVVNGVGGVNGGVDVGGYGGAYSADMYAPMTTMTSATMPMASTVTLPDNIRFDNDAYEPDIAANNGANKLASFRVSSPHTAATLPFTLDEQKRAKL